MRSLVLFCLAGCDALFRLTAVPEPPGVDASGADARPGNCFRESFSGTDSDLLVNWDRSADSSACRAILAGGQLRIEIAPGSNCYADALTKVRPSFVGNTASVHVTDATTATDAETLFAIEIDPSNTYFFFVGGSTLGMFERASDVDMQLLEIPYDPALHAYWQFVHEVDAARISFQTSPDGASWVERHSVSVVVPLDALAVRLEAGTYNGGLQEAEAATFDDFERCAP